jgi:hypothetical protein
LCVQTPDFRLGQGISGADSCAKCGDENFQNSL